MANIEIDCNVSQQLACFLPKLLTFVRMDVRS